VDPAGWLSFLIEVADRGDRIALERFRAQDLHVREKPDLGPVTEADLAIEEAARDLVARRHPRLGVFGEEHGETRGHDDVRLVIDPIDATRNFVRGIPIFATLLAIESAGEIVAGLVSAPALATRWYAARGAGAHCGTRRLQVSGIGDLASAQVFHGSVAGSEGSERSPGLIDLLRASRRQRGFGDFYQHVLVAEGAGEVSVDPILQPWDAAPLQVIVEEAGGRATALDGRRTIYAGSLVCTNGRLHEEALKLLLRS
jgi:histidinol-phosphatase